MLSAVGKHIHAESEADRLLGTFFYGYPYRRYPSEATGRLTASIERLAGDELSLATRYQRAHSQAK